MIDMTDLQNRVHDKQSGKQEEIPENDVNVSLPGGSVTDQRDDQKADYSSMTREELVKSLKDLINGKPVREFIDHADVIKINFYKKLKAETEKKRKAFVEDGNDLEDFQPLPDPLEEQFQELFKKYKELKSEYNRSIEKEKKENLQERLRIIEDIKALVNTKESINKTFQEFHELQRQWREAGPIPQKNVRNIWGTYNHHVEKFYDYIKINKELRDLDFKKNLEIKEKLCGKAERLLEEPNVVNAFKTLQKYHEKWRETGPVPRKLREEMWQRFKNSTSQINKKHQKFYEELRLKQENNLEKKTALCEEVEAINGKEPATHKEWDQYSKKVIGLQKGWRTIGFTPRKYNNEIYERFRKACDDFFNRKREFYAQNKELQLQNLEEKKIICEKAESIMDSTDWKKTTTDLINLQRKWKETGPVPKKDSEKIWKRFRAACDYFFNRKSDHYKTIDQSYEENMKKKEELIREMDALELGDDADKDFRKLNELQKNWKEIGYVPREKKNEIQKKYRDALNRQYDNLDIEDQKKDRLKYRTKLHSIVQKPKAGLKLQQEREKHASRLQQLKNDMVVWENNVGFFADTKKAESLIAEVKKKISKARNDIELLESKIEMIDSMNSDHR